MARILFVHGMSREISESTLNFTTKNGLVSDWRKCLIKQLEDHAPRVLPLAEDDFDVAFWAELYQPPSTEASKGLIEAWDTAATSPLRAAVRWLDRRSRFTDQGKPLTIPARMGFGFVYQTVFYMANEPSRLHRDSAGRGVYEQVQEIFKAGLESGPKVVIAHSLGTVIAYEGLCALGKHSVDTLVTIGSPLGARRLIYDKLRPEAMDGRRPWPGVRRWINIASVKDFVCVPEPSLKDLFRGEVEDHVMTFGSALFPGSVHRFQRYLREDGAKEGIIPKAVAAALGH